MYNTDLPNRAELPSSQQLRRSTMIAVLVAAVLLVTVVLPAEYGIDPTRIGRVLGLTQMGEIKMSLAREAAQDRAAATTASVQPPADTSPPLATPQTQITANPSAPRTDEMSVTLKPGEGAEVKLEMSQGAKVTYEWTAAGGPVNHDTHADNPRVKYHGYRKGQQVERDSGELIAAFDGKHGWFWRNRGNADVTVTLKTNGVYRSIKRVV